MFSICTASLHDEVYRAFIEVAFERSDLISIRVDWPDENSFPSKELALNSGISETVYNRCVESYYRRVYPNIQLFKQKKIPFLKKLEPYFVNGDTLAEKQWVYHVLPCKDILQLFQSVEGINNWKYPYYPEDLSFAKDGEFWFKSISHEDYAQLAVSSTDEYAFWTQLGIKFLDDYTLEK